MVGGFECGLTTEKQKKRNGGNKERLKGLSLTEKNVVWTLGARKNCYFGWHELYSISQVTEEKNKLRRFQCRLPVEELSLK